MRLHESDFSSLSWRSMVLIVWKFTFFWSLPESNCYYRVIFPIVYGFIGYNLKNHLRQLSNCTGSWTFILNENARNKKKLLALLDIPKSFISQLIPIFISCQKLRLMATSSQTNSGPTLPKSSLISNSLPRNRQDNARKPFPSSIFDCYRFLSLYFLQQSSTLKMDYLSIRSFQDIQSLSLSVSIIARQIGRALMSERNSIRGHFIWILMRKSFHFPQLCLWAAAEPMKSQKWNQSINLALRGGRGGKRDFLPVLLAAYFGAFEDGQGRRGCICSGEKSFLEVGKIEFRLCRWR